MHVTNVQYELARMQASGNSVSACWNQPTIYSAQNVGSVNSVWGKLAGWRALESACTAEVAQRQLGPCSRSFAVVMCWRTLCFVAVNATWQTGCSHHGGVTSVKDCKCELTAIFHDENWTTTTIRGNVTGGLYYCKTGGSSWTPLLWNSVYSYGAKSEEDEICNQPNFSFFPSSFSPPPKRLPF